MLIVLPFTAITTAKQSKEVRPTFQRIRDCFSSLNAFVQENVSGNRVVKAFAKEDFEIEKFNKENDAYMDAQLNSSKVWMKYLPIFEVLAYVLNVVLMLYGGWMVITGEMTIAVIKSRIRKSTRRLEVNMTFIISPGYFPFLTVLPVSAGQQSALSLSASERHCPGFSGYSSGLRRS